MPAAVRTQAGAPTLIPVPSLLRSLLSEHLDPGYAAAAASAERRRAAGPARDVDAGRCCAALLIATVFAAAVAQAQATRARRARPSRCWPAACDPPRHTTN